MGQQSPDKQQPFEQPQWGQQVPPQYPQPHQLKSGWLTPNQLPPYPQFQQTPQQSGQFQPPTYSPYTGSQSQQQNSIADQTTQPKIDRIKGNRPLGGSKRGTAITRHWLYFLVAVCVAIGVAAIVLIWVFHIGQAKSTSQQTVTAIPANERQVIQAYNQAVTKQDWITVYTYTSNSVIGDYTKEQFAQMMVRQEQSEGKVVSITVTSNPQVFANSAGGPYFTVQEQVVTDKNGITQTHSLISLYLLEDGAWKYWFSKKA